MRHPSNGPKIVAFTGRRVDEPTPFPTRLALMLLTVFLVGQAIQAGLDPAPAERPPQGEGALLEV